MSNQGDTPNRDPYPQEPRRQFPDGAPQPSWPGQPPEPRQPLPETEQMAAQGLSGEPQPGPSQEQPQYASPGAPYADGSQRPPSGPGRRRRGGAKWPALALLAALLLFGIGMFAGWQIGTKNASALPSLNGAPPPVTLPDGNSDKAREAVIEKVRPAVVQINVSSSNGNSLGSGVIIDQRGYIITNNHVIEGGQKFQVVLANGTSLPAQVVGTAPMEDLAVIKIDPSRTKLTVVALGDSSNLNVGQSVLVIGNPLGITQTVTNGIISALDRNVANPDGALLPSMIQTDAPINPGNSGGALVDSQGSLIGIPTLVPLDPQFKTPANGVGFAVPVNRVKFIAPQLIKDGRVTHSGRAALGIQGASVDPQLAAQSNLPVDHGVLVGQIVPRGPADQAGMRVGDIIVQIDNTPITDTSSLADALINKNPGDTVKVTFYRGGQQMSANVKLGELAAS